jgi:hypothetical protein
MVETGDLGGLFLDGLSGPYFIAKFESGPCELDGKDDCHDGHQARVVSTY